MKRIAVLWLFLFPSVVLSQSFGGSFVMPVKRDITQGQWVDYANFYLYVAEGTAGLHVYQIYPDSIGHKGGFAGTGDYQCVHVKGNYAYVAAGSGGLQIIDVSNSAAMSVVGSIANPDLRVLYHYGQYVYAGSFSKLFIYDVSNPMAITLVSETDLPGNPLRIMADDNRVFLALGSAGGGLQVVNVANPAAPVLTHLITYQGFVYDCVIYPEESWAYLLVVAEGPRYHVYSIQNPASPPAHMTSDSVGGKVSRIAYPGYVVGKDGSTIRLYDREHIVASHYAPGASAFIAEAGSQHVAACGDSLLFMGILTSSTDEVYTPAEYRLSDIYPNPFNPSARVRLLLDQPGYVTAELISSLGEKIETLAEGNFAEGTHEFEVMMQGYTSGVYFVRFMIAGSSAGNAAVEIKKAVLLR
ncbi:MAG: hypothetical protein HRU80_03595 [Ignavibacteriales bacterium]|nr:MAG: hypothetical protein HRU80_03595 [Ignavibacteriales bacterium]